MLKKISKLLLISFLISLTNINTVKSDTWNDVKAETAKIVKNEKLQSFTIGLLLPIIFKKIKIKAEYSNSFRCLVCISYAFHDLSNILPWLMGDTLGIGLISRN